MEKISYYLTIVPEYAKHHSKLISCYSTGRTSAYLSTYMWIHECSYSVSIQCII